MPLPSIYQLEPLIERLLPDGMRTHEHGAVYPAVPAARGVAAERCGFSWAIVSVLSPARCCRATLSLRGCFELLVVPLRELVVDGRSHDEAQRDGDDETADDGDGERL